MAISGAGRCSLPQRPAEPTGATDADSARGDAAVLGLWVLAGCFAHAVHGEAARGCWLL